MSNFQFSRQFTLPLKQIKKIGQKTENFLEFYVGRIGPGCSFVYFIFFPLLKELKTFKLA